MAVTILRIVRKEHPPWLPRGEDPIEPKVQKKLRNGILPLPDSLSHVGLPTAVRKHLEPLDVPNTLIDEAKEELLDAGLIHSREIEHRATGCPDLLKRLYFCRGHKVGFAKADLDRDSSTGRSHAPAEYAANIFRKRGDYWEVRFQGQPAVPAYVKPLVGMERIHRLLLSSGQPVPAIELVTKKKPTRAPRAAGPEHADYAQGYQGETSMDQRALKECRDRLAKLDREMAKAEQDNDEALKQRLQEEKGCLLAMIRGATTRDGKLRKLVDPNADRARKTVSETINDAIEGIRAHVPELADHLDASIDHGFEFRYRPHEQIQWDL